MPAGRPASLPRRSHPLRRRLWLNAAGAPSSSRPTHAPTDHTTHACAPRGRTTRGIGAPTGRVSAAQDPERTASRFEGWAIAAFGLRTARTTLDHGPTGRVPREGVSGGRICQPTHLCPLIGLFAELERLHGGRSRALTPSLLIHQEGPPTRGRVPSRRAAGSASSQLCGTHEHSSHGSAASS